MNKSPACVRITNVGPNRTLSHLLHKNVNDTIKNTWWHEEVLNCIVFIAALKSCNVIEQTKTDVLLQSSVVKIVMEHIFLDLANVPSSDVVVRQVSLTRGGHSVHLISNAEAFFSGHDAPGLIPAVIFFLESAEGLAGEHTLPVVLGEDCVPANV